MTFPQFAEVEQPFLQQQRQVPANRTMQPQPQAAGATQNVALQPTWQQAQQPSESVPAQLWNYAPSRTRFQPMQFVPNMQTVLTPVPRPGYAARSA